MGRIRSIKPDIHLDEELWDLEQDTGFPIFRAFTGLWGQADREGRFEWRPRKLKAAILPYWDGDFSRVLHALATRGFVQKYEVDGRAFGVVRTFTKHQVINNKEAASSLPEPTEENLIQTGTYTGDSREVLRVDDACFTREVKAQGEGKGKEGNGKGRELSLRPTPKRGQGAVAPKVARPPKDPPPTAAVWEAYAAAYRERYGAEPVRNARVNGQLAQFIQRVRHDEAPLIAASYVHSPNARYVAAGHPVGLMLQDAETLRTEAITGQRRTASKARREDRTADRAGEFDQLFERLEAEDARRIGNA